jgi:HlyD family secretion protein
MALVACAGEQQSTTPLETTRASAFVETLSAPGELRSAEVTPLNVPGGNFEQRTVSFIVDDGARVKKDQLIARFEAVDASKNLSQQELELMRNALKLASEKAQASVAASAVQTDRADVIAELSLSERYADIEKDASYISKNELLDKLQDLGLLRVRQSTADWRIGHQAKRSDATQAVTVAQRSTVQANVDRYRQSLSELELRAPHAGVFRLNTNWDGSKLTIGGSAWAGDDFASLPDLDKLLARLSLPQGAAEGLQAGQRAEVRLAGTGQVLPGKVVRVGASASVRSRDNPVKYVEFDVALDANVIAGLRLTPGQAVSATVFLVEKSSVMTVPNTALELEPIASAAQPKIAEQASNPINAGAKLDPKLIRQARTEQTAQVASAPLQERKGFVFSENGEKIPITIATLGRARSEVTQGLAEGVRIRVLAPSLQTSAASSTSAGRKS